MERIWVAVAALAGAASVGADAASRHLLAGDAYRLDLAATAARYGLVHAVALLAAAVLLRRAGGGASRAWLLAAGWCFVAGLVLFRGSLDLLAAGLLPGIARATPLGGMAFIAGWAALLCHAPSPRRAA